jgi:hypothetical protein
MKTTNTLLAIAFLSFFATTHLFAQDYHSAFRIGASQHDESQGIAQDSQGNIYLSGNFEGTVDFDPSGEEATLTAINKYDAYLAKYDSDGNFIWVISIGGTEWIYGRHIALDAGGNIYMAGYFKGEADFDPSSNDYMLEGVELDGFLAKYDPEGNFVWAFDIGNDFNGTSYDVDIDMQGNIWVTGVFRDAVDFDPSENEFILTGHGLQDCYVAKYTQDGEFIWAGEFGGETSTFYNPTIAFDESGDLYYTTYYTNQVDLDPGPGTQLVESAGSSDIMLVKLDASGNFQWGFSMGGVFQDHARDICFSNGHILLTGFFEETIDFDPSSGEAIFTSEGDYDAYIAAYTPQGEYIWAKALASADPAEGLGLTTDDNDNIYLCGSFWGTVDFDPSSSVSELTVQGGWDLFAAKYDPSGNFQWVINAGGNDNDYAYNMIVTSDQADLMVCGKFMGYAEFDHTGPGHILSSSGGFDGFLASYSTFPGSDVGEAANDAIPFTISPNPSSGKIFIQYTPSRMEVLEIQVTTLEGKLVKEFRFDENLGGMDQYEIDMSGMNDGIYLVTLTNGIHKASRKLIIKSP